MTRTIGKNFSSPYVQILELGLHFVLLHSLIRYAIDKKELITNDLLGKIHKSCGQQNQWSGNSSNKGRKIGVLCREIQKSQKH